MEDFYAAFKMSFTAHKPDLTIRRPFWPLLSARLYTGIPWKRANRKVMFGTILYLHTLMECAAAGLAKRKQQSTRLCILNAQVGGLDTVYELNCPRTLGRVDRKSINTKTRLKGDRIFIFLLKTCFSWIKCCRICNTLMSKPKDWLLLCLRNKNSLRNWETKINIQANA